MDSSCGGMVKAGIREKSTGGRRVLVTRRQAQILELAATDLADKQIARLLGVCFPRFLLSWGASPGPTGCTAERGLLACDLGRVAREASCVRVVIA
jgi:hypothetical protein